MKKVIIIGAGISGLTAGIYLQKAGFESLIFEKNSIPGGECTGWKREGVYIDNCMHFLTGSRYGSDLNKLWNEIDMLGEDVKIYEKKSFFSYENESGKITFWRDLERTRKEMLELAPYDEEEIEKFIENVKRAESMIIPTEKPADMMKLEDYFSMSHAMKDINIVLEAYKDMNISDFADQFKNPVLKKAFRSILSEEYMAFSFIVSYATITAGNGDIPLGGSLMSALRIAKKYDSLGGTIKYNSAVEKIILVDDKAKGVILDNGEEVYADYIVCSTDVNHTFTKLLPEIYMPDQLQDVFEDTENFRVFSGFHVAFIIDCEHSIPKGMNYFEIDEIEIANSKVSAIGINNYDYDPLIKPNGKSVIQVHLIENQEDIEFWKKLKKETDSYKNKKSEYAMQIQLAIEKKYKEVKQHIKCIDVWTPITYEKYCNAYDGAYMAFIVGKDKKFETIPGVLEDVDNVYIASQWLNGTGGLPCAAAMGKHAALRIAIKEGSNI